MSDTLQVFGVTYNNVAGFKATDDNDDTQTYIKPEGSLSISQNGTVDVTQYAGAVVNVPNSYSAGDDGKVVSNGALVSQTAHADVTPTTSDQTIDTTLNNSLKVKGDADLVAGNIKKDVEIFGVTGSYEGGGGSQLTLLASGSYTKTNYSSDNSKVDIPVSFTGTPTMAFVESTPLDATAQTYQWIRQDGLPDLVELDVYFHMNVYVSAGGSVGSGTGNITFQSNNTILRCNQQSSSYHVQNNTYYWYIWGVPS